jgi:photosystem II stability/assembly factor-like uncharacterized protein
VYAASTGGLFRSDDAGRTWQAAGAGIGAGAISALTLHPRAPDTLYAAAADGTLFRSDDAGATWQRIGS